MLAFERKWDEYTLTKRSVARENVDCAIELLFRQEFLVSANVLAWAASDVLNDIATSKGLQSFRANMFTAIKPEHHKDWRKHLKRDYNFSKHANMDPNEEIQSFRPEAMTFTLLEACWEYYQIYNQMSWSMFVYRVWFTCRNPDVSPEGLEELTKEMAPKLGYPMTAPFEWSVEKALDLLQTGIKHPRETAKLLGPNLIEAIEGFAGLLPKQIRMRPRPR